ncbi:hypothetical protein SETIT_5G404000v2 [Setaria italica]|uniref:Uncharacterized protein n=1 Tax=Setaria italica TaxID=4555 RepID=A0A368RED4_SETIT|nr:hypothetical protein SETIT_5G404000v2 [Setaria italica]RCV28428.1 hypothetical protein SETIT_5G404000v2 [Setaria italica]RCV28429.1 hypothetical protein SETIT_5G404000v2 [Setaria italica]
MQYEGTILKRYCEIYQIFRNYPIFFPSFPRLARTRTGRRRRLCGGGRRRPRQAQHPEAATTPRPSSSRFLPFVAEPSPRHAVAAARLVEEREAAVAPTPLHPRLISSASIGFDPWRRRGS